MELFARGCHCYIEQRPLPTDAMVNCYRRAAGQPIPDLVLQLLSQAREYELGPGIKFRRVYDYDNSQEAALYAFQFWDLPPFLVMAFAPTVGPVSGSP
jgi:hypothetical protein